MTKIAPPTVMVNTVLPPLLQTAGDPVPNVKFNLCKVLQVRVGCRPLAARPL